VIYDGTLLGNGRVQLGRARAEEVRATAADAVVRTSMNWIDRAESEDSILYFGIYRDSNLVGQIFLHDISEAEQEALIAYHLFTESVRRLGTGTQALRLLQLYLISTRLVRTAIIITSKDNPASQRLATRCGFAFRGSAREDPAALAYQWRVPQES
jgi:RimJ/RimL family protein N-acetyltransferase